MSRKHLLGFFVLLLLLGVGYWQRHRLWNPSAELRQVPLEEQVQQAITRTVSYLLQTQHPDGHWEGEVMYNVTSTAAMVLVHHQIEREDPTWIQAALDWIERHQNPDGSWGVILSSSLPDAQATALAVLALEENGRSDSKSAHRAREWLDEHGGVQRAGLLAQVFYALYDRYAWEDISLPPIETLLTEEGRTQVYESKGIWNRDVLPAAMILKTLALPVEDVILPANAQEKSSPAPTPNPSFPPPTPITSPAMPPTSAFPPQAMRQQALKQSAQILLQNQWQDGSWGGTTMATFLAIIALHHLDAQAYDESIERGLAFLERMTHAEGYVERFRLPVWDTALTVLALCRPSLMEQQNVQHACERAKAWLLQAQSPEGGWSFVPNPGSAAFLDNDDTALALAALSMFSEDEKMYTALRRGLDYLVARQNDDGGWAAFAHNVDQKAPGPLPPYFRAPEVIFADPSTADVTGHVLYAFGRIYRTMPDLVNEEVYQSAQRALDFLRQDQMKDGKWYGRWGICYLYGTGVVLQGLKEAKGLINFPEASGRRAVNWLTKVQHSNGGWGEWYLAFFDEQWAGVGFSTPGQTAFVLLGLRLSVPASTVEKGVAFLVVTQRKDGAWPSDVLLSGISVYSDSHFASIMPFWALSEYQDGFPP